MLNRVKVPIFSPISFIFYINQMYSKSLSALFYIFLNIVAYRFLNQS